MIQLIESEAFDWDEKGSFERVNYELLIDNEFLPNINVFARKYKPEKQLIFQVETDDIYSGEKLLNQNISEFPEFEFIQVPIESDCEEFETFIMIFPESKNNKEQRIQFYFDAKLLDWKKTYSFTEFEESLREIIPQFSKRQFEISIYNNNDETKFLIESKIKFGELTIKEELTEFINECKTFYLEARKNLQTKKDKETIVNYFVFPDEIQINCKQYLEYFVKFLQDLGINATSKFNNQAGKVLFSVTPTDDVEALDKIREALAVYLNLPASPISDLEYSENFALMRLQQQVRNLQHSQQMAKTELLSAQYALGLAQSNIENQDRIIVRQHSTIENLNKIIEKVTSNSIMTDSLDKKDKEGFEEICEGLRVGESKWLRELTGVGLSTGKFVKAIVKNTFGKEEKNSILGLNEE